MIQLQQKNKDTKLILDQKIHLIDLSENIISVIFEFVGPIVLDEEYFSTSQVNSKLGCICNKIISTFTNKIINKTRINYPTASTLIKNWYVKFPNNKIKCLYPKVQIRFKKVSILLDKPKYCDHRGEITHKEEMKLKDKNIDLSQWLPSKGITSLDIADSMVENTISSASLSHFTELIEFKFFNSEWDSIKTTKYSKTWQPYNLRKFLASQKHLQVLEMHTNSWSEYSLTDDDVRVFPTTLRYLNIQRGISCHVTLLSELVAKNQNLESLKALITSIEKLDLSSASKLTHVELMSWDYPNPGMDIKFNNSLQSFVELQRVHLSETTAIDLLHLPYLEELVMGGQNPEFAFPAGAYSHFAGNKSLKKLSMNDADFWKDALKYVAQCESLEEIVFNAGGSGISDYEKRIPYEEIKTVAEKMKNLKKWNGSTREQHAAYAENMKDPEIIKLIEEFRKEIKRISSDSVLFLTEKF